MIMNEQLRHLLATISYRLQKSIANAGDTFGDFRIHEKTRTPSEIVNHMYDVLRKTISAIEESNWDLPKPEPLTFDLEIKRFLADLKRLDQVFSKTELKMETSKRLIQGPLSDMITHIGQLAMLNGLHGSKVPYENFFKAEVKLDDGSI